MINRRQVIQASATALALQSLCLNAGETVATTHSTKVIKRPIPSSGEFVPAIGMGTSRTFDTADDAQSLAKLRNVMHAFFDGQGTVIDSSPMYGRAETRVGDLLRTMESAPKPFAATKVWTDGRKQGLEQMAESARRMNVEKFDLIAVHNLKDWKTQLATLKEWKKEGKVRYLGITTSHGRFHDELLQIMSTEPLDFVQFSYNIEDRMAEKELLPLAADRGIATMINRPYQRGSLFSKASGHDLPVLASELGCSSWGQFFLKFILSHPAVTCIIPATAKLSHMKDNMQANFGAVPDTAQRKEMLNIFASL